MNEQQQRALWGAALHTLADSISHGAAPMPHSIDLHTHDLDYVTLLEHADLSTPDPLQVKILKTFAAINIPTGKPIELPIIWAMYADLPASEDERAFQLKQYEAHNEACVGGKNVTFTHEATPTLCRCDDPAQELFPHPAHEATA